MSAPNGTPLASDPGLDLAQAAVAALIQAGVAEFVVCAGARNAALVAVLAATPGARLWSFPEERCAGFFALGRSRAAEAPIAVVTTSGTAVAELLPAVIEAHYLRVPIVLVTADRPREFRGTGAPQAIEQPGIFGPYVSASADVATVAELGAAKPSLTPPFHRPLHLNLCLEEPSAAALASASAPGVPAGAARPSDLPPFKNPPFRTDVPSPAQHRRDAQRRIEAFLADTASGPLVAVVAALPEWERPGAAAFLKRLGCPVIAEATSGLRESQPLAEQRAFAGETSLAALPVGRVLRLGGVPSSRWWRDLENRPQVRVLSLTSSGFPGLARPSDVEGIPDWSALSVPSKKAELPETVLEAARAQAAEVDRALAAHPRSEPSLVRALSDHIPSDSLVFLGNSLPIREWNIFATQEDRRFHCHANRGANGIDGCVSTFLGLAAHSPESWAVIGDLTALYDLAALWITEALPPGRRRIALLNNGGGRIFSRVAALKGLPDTPRRIMENPHHLSYEGWAAMFGWAYAAATTPHAVADAVRRTEPHLILEITPDPRETEAVWASLSPTPVNPLPGTGPSPRTP